MRIDGSFGLCVNPGGVELLTAQDPVDMLTPGGPADAFGWWAW